MSASRARSGVTPGAAPPRRRAARLAAVPIAAAVVAAAAASAAWAFWSLPGGGNGATDAGTLAEPTGVAGSSVPGSGIVDVTWDPVTAPDGGAVDGYVVERLQGATLAQACGSSIVSPLPAAATSCSDPVSVAGVYTYRVTALFRSWSATGDESDPVDVVLDITPPGVVSITRADASPTAAASVSWTVTFDEPVSGVDTGDFALAQAGGLAGASIDTVSGGPTAFTVTAQTGGPAGTLRLDLVDDDSILDTAPNPLGGAGPGNGDLQGQVYDVDTTPPTGPALTLSGAIGNTFLSGTTAYVNAQASRSGAFTVTAATTDPDTGIDSVAFPFPAGFSAGGGTDTAAPFSTDYAWSGAVGASGAYAVTATNGAGVASDADLTIVPDTTAPTGGSLTIDGGAAYTSGSSVTIASTGFAETLSPTASGLAANAVTREYAVLTADACGAFTSMTTVTSNGVDPGLITGCYRYALTGADNVGNWASASSIVRVDTSAPSTPALTIVDTAPGSSDGMHVTGTTVYARGTAGASGTFTVTAATADGDTGILDVTFPSLAGLTGGGADTGAPYAAAYDWSGAFSATGAQDVTARNLAAGSSTAAFTLVSDTTAPTGGSLSANAGGAYDTTGTVAISATAYAETQTPTQSGLESSVLVRESATLTGDACGTFSGPVAVAPPSDGPLANGCYRYTLTGTDNVGNVATIQQIVKVDTSAPALPALLLTSPTGSTHVAGTTAYVNAQAGRSGSFVVQATPTDGDTGILDVALPTVSGFTAGGGTDTSSPYATTYSWAGAAAAAGVGTHTVTARNPTFLSTSGTFSIVSDTTAPAGGALTANGTSATGGGTTSTSATGSYAVTKTDYAETQSTTAAGLAGSDLTRAVGTPASGTCSGFGSATTFAGTSETGLALGCYRYVLTGTDNVGNAATLTTTVIAAPVKITSIVAGTGTAVTISGTAVFGAGNGQLLVCRVNTAPTCSGPNRAFRDNTVAVGGDYTWSQATGNLTGATTYYAWFTQGTTTSPVVAFPPLPYTAP